MIVDSAFASEEGTYAPVSLIKTRVKKCPSAFRILSCLPSAVASRSPRLGSDALFQSHAILQASEEQVTPRSRASTTSSSTFFHTRGRPEEWLLPASPVWRRTPERRPFARLPAAPPPPPQSSEEFYARQYDRKYGRYGTFVRRPARLPEPPVPQLLLTPPYHPPPPRSPRHHYPLSHRPQYSLP